MSPVGPPPRGSHHSPQGEGTPVTHAIFIPKLGLTMEDAIVVEWGFADGAQVHRGDTVVTIETDKITFDVEAEHDGYLQRVAPVGAKLLVGDLAGYLHPMADAALAAGQRSAAPAFPGVPAATAPIPAAAHPANLGAAKDASGRRLMASPVARQLASARDLDLATVTGSGPGGVILKRDVEAAPPRTAPPAQASIAVAAMATTIIAPGTLTRRPMTAMRKAIAQRMMQSLASKAQMTGFGRVDMAEATRLRETLVDAADTLGVRITYTDLVLKAAATVLAAMPEMSAWIEGDDIVSWNAVHIGLAVSVNGGLIVPVIRHVDQLSLVELSHARLALIDKARSGKLTRADVDGGTFTLSNFGSYGGDFETPILNAPQSALLGIGQIRDEAVVRDKQIVIRPMMSISLTFDHCLIDGAMAGEFRSRFKALLEQPALLLARLR
ncbi:MAG: 2-oxo acid dehydrogenase subunit E2 [Betaproteobacteria bacterium]|nr:2-oxo acid dehydrogenase subunit E2 [Betaproteobacteria bacterium]